MVGGEMSHEDASAEMYRLHGQAVSDAAAAEFYLRLIALLYGDGCGDHSPVRRCWEAVKSILREHRLTDSLQQDLAAVALLFDARNQIAHRFVLMTTGPSQEWCILRYWIEGGEWHMHQLDFSELRSEVERARAGRDASEAIFNAVREKAPTALDVPKIPHGLPGRF